jgi:hypothetical protein
VNRHVSLDELARLGADDLKPRKAVRLRRHLGTCSQCTQLNSQLSAVAAVLSSVEFGPIPEILWTRIEGAMVVEARLRLAGEPATEPGRRDLPTARKVALSRSWRLPGLSVAATRAVATAGAIGLIGVGGYEVASHASPPMSTSSSAAPASPSAAASQAIRARISYGHEAVGSFGNARQRRCARRRGPTSARTGSHVRPACTSRATSVRRSRVRH